MTWSMACMEKLKVMNSQMGLRPACGGKQEEFMGKDVTLTESTQSKQSHQGCCVIHYLKSLCHSGQGAEGVNLFAFFSPHLHRELANTETLRK